MPATFSFTSQKAAMINKGKMPCVAILTCLVIAFTLCEMLHTPSDNVVAFPLLLVLEVHMLCKEGSRG